MSAWWTVMRKELLDAFRDRRMVLMALLLMPVAVPLLIAGLGSIGAKRQAEKLEKTLELPVIGAEHAPNLVAWLGTNDVSVLPPPADPDAAVRAQEHALVLRIDPRYGEDWRAGRPAAVEIIYDSSRPMQSGATIARVRALLGGYDA